MARVRRTTGPLDLRSQAILRAVIEEYVTTAAPVGSQALVERYRLGVSSATVRNILAELEAVALDERLGADRGRGRDVFLDDGPEDRLSSEVQRAGGATYARQGLLRSGGVSTLAC